VGIVLVGSARVDAGVFPTRLTELLCAGCVHDFEHYLSSLVAEMIVSFLVFAPGARVARR
jgi:hypothetical protein